MFKSKATITAVIMVAVALFVVIAVSSVFFGTNDAYREVAPRQVQQAAPTEETEAMTDEALEQLMAEEQQAMESVVEEEVVESATEVVEQATKAAVQSTEDVTDIAQAAIDAAAQQAAEGREQADQLVEELAATTEEQVSPVAATAQAQTHVVTAEALVFNPVVITIQPGDTVSWVNMPTHDTQSLEGLIPEGAEHWHSEMSQNYSRTFTQEGIYVYKCTPHFGSAMGGAIIVGNPVNIEEIRNAGARGAAGRLVRQALAVADAM
ncbi:MAG: pseudoazurin precursor [Methylophaga sp.]|nr:pseudoazurin precursor [Methylophaga sp.]